MSRRRLLLAAALAAITAVVAFTFGSGLGHNPQVVRSVLIDRRAPALSGRTLSGGSLGPAQLAGKVLLVTVWASWCPSCRAEQPILDAAQQRWGPAGLQVVGIDMSDQAS
ncbi:MAG: TlpA family protein disulfide reductase, partial [Mycobacteriales bacterium]